MKNIHPAIICGYLCVLVVLVFLAYNTYYGHYKKDGQLYEALHIFLPGYETVHYPEQIVDLSNWTGTKYSNLVANNPDGTENAEVTAGLALKALGLYGDYEFKEIDGRTILYRPERQVRYFTLQARYRIGKGKPCQCHTGIKAQ
jgi:hypothetical protein